MRITIPVSAGELIDKLTILNVKVERLTAPEKLQNVAHELRLLEAIRTEALPELADLARLEARLQEVNARLWDIEDAKRGCEKAAEFGPEFIELARLVYILNDERADLKRQINFIVGSEIIEEKSHSSSGAH